MNTNKDHIPFDRKEFDKFIELKTYGGDYMAAPKNIIENPEDVWKWIITEIELLKQQIKGET